MNKNDILDIKIEAITSQGEGIGKSDDGLKIFVPNAAIGEVIKVRIIMVKKRYAHAKIKKILEPSKQRIREDCSESSKCGGCVFRHIKYKEELRIKKQSVVDAIERIAGLEGLQVEEIVRADSFKRYRNKAILPISTTNNGKIEIGFYSRNTHRVIDSDDCLLHPEVFSQIIMIFREWVSSNNISVYNEETQQGILRHVFLRSAGATNQILVCVVVNAGFLPFKDVLIDSLLKNIKGIKSIWMNINTKKTNVVLGGESHLIYGENYIEDVLCGFRFRFSLHSFYQVNRQQTEKLYSIARNCADLKKDDVLLDLYCGVGTIGITMAKYVKKVIGVECVEESIKMANKNAFLNELSNVQFILADAFCAIEVLQLKKEKVDVVVIDPPRKGSSSETIDLVVKLLPERIVYISCNPSTLARDLKILCNDKYEVKRIVPIDMFPRTGHCEVCVKLCRK